MTAAVQANTLAGQKIYKPKPRAGASSIWESLNKRVLRPSKHRLMHRFTFTYSKYYVSIANFCERVIISMLHSVIQIYKKTPRSPLRYLVFFSFMASYTDTFKSNIPNDKSSKGTIINLQSSRSFPRGYSKLVLLYRHVEPNS